VSAFSPLCEVAAGNGYWAALLRARGADVNACDVRPPADGKGFCPVAKAGPEYLETPAGRDRNLFLCYPDQEADSVALSCLQKFVGEFVVCAGEEFAGGTKNMRAAPFGRSCNPEFQEALATDFHCVLRLDLPCHPLAQDTLTVWKRTAKTTIVYGGDDDDDEPAPDGDGDDEDDVDHYAYVPEEERIPLDAAAPFLKHLLERKS
jgi:hypothetical protein